MYLKQEKGFTFMDDGELFVKYLSPRYIYKFRRYI